MKKPLVYIAGLPRVGSTLLDQILGCHPRFVGLGELYEALRPDWRHLEADHWVCSCGLSIRKCPYWSRLASTIDYDAPVLENYKIAYSILTDLLGRDVTLVDSSKSIAYLKQIISMNEFDIKIIYLIRDVRAWIVSRIDAVKKEPEYYGWNGYYIQNLIKKYGWKIQLMRPIMPVLVKLSSYFFLLWYIQNKQNLKYLQNRGFPYLKISYDELGLVPELVFKQLATFLELKNFEVPKNFFESKSHILIGNTMGKYDPRRRTGIRYDSRWLYRTEWLIPAALFRPIMKFNTEEVYRNISGKTIFKIN